MINWTLVAVAIQNAKLKTSQKYLKTVNSDKFNLKINFSRLQIKDAVFCHTKHV